MIQQKRLLNNLFIIQSVFLPLTFLEVIILSLNSTETRLLSAAPLCADDVKIKIKTIKKRHVSKLNQKKKVCSVMLKQAFDTFTVNIYSILHLYINVPGLN